MATKDGIIQIGFDYRAQLEKATKEINQSLDEVGKNSKISANIKPEIQKIKQELKQVLDTSNDFYTKNNNKKLNTSTFTAFKKQIEKQLQEIESKISNLYKITGDFSEKINSISSTNGVGNLTGQFKGLRNEIGENLKQTKELIAECEKIGHTPVLSVNNNISSDIKKTYDELKKLIQQISNEEIKFGYDKKSLKELEQEHDILVDKYRLIQNEIEKTQNSMLNMSKATNSYKEQDLYLSKLLAHSTLYALKIEEIQGLPKFDDAYNWKQKINYNELDKIYNNTIYKIDEIIEKSNQSMIEVEKLFNLTTEATSIPQNMPIANAKKRESQSSKQSSIKTEIHISTKSSTLIKQLEEIISKVQERAISTPVIVPIKLRVDTESVGGKQGKTTQNQIETARKELSSTEKDVSVNLDKVATKSLSLATKNAFNIAQDSLKQMQSLFDSNPLLVKLKVAESEKQKIASEILNTNTENNKVNIAGEIGKSRKELKALYDDFNSFVSNNGLNSWLDNFSSKVISGLSKIKETSKSQDIIKEADSQQLFTIIQRLEEVKEIISSINQSGIKLDGIKEISISIAETINNFETLSNILTSIQNLEKTVARGTGIVSSSDISAQWAIVEQSLNRITKKDGEIKKNQVSNINAVAQAYQKYVQMGGKNPLENLGKSKNTIEALKIALTQLPNINSQLDNEVVGFTNIRKTVDELTTAIGSTKVKAINKEATTMDNASQKEVLSLTNVLNTINQIVTKLNTIKGVKLPKFEFKGIEKLKLSEEQKEGLAELSKILEKINALTNIPNIINGLRVSKTQSENVKALSSAFLEIHNALVSIDKSSSGSNFLNQISKITSQSEALKNLATILKSTKKQIEEANNAVSNSDDSKQTSSKTSSIKSDTDSQKTTEKAVKDYEKATNDIIKARNNIASGKNIEKNFDNLTYAIERQSKAYEELGDSQNKVNETKKKSEKQLSLLTGQSGQDFTKRLDALNSGDTATSEKINEVKSNIAEFQSLEQRILEGEKGVGIQKYQQLRTQIEATISALEKYSGAQNSAGKLTGITNIGDTNAISQYVQQLTNCNAETIKTANNGNKVVATYKDQNRNLMSLTMTYNQTLGQYVASNDVLATHQGLWTRLGKSIKGSIQYVQHYFSGYMVAMRVVSALRTGIQSIKDLDSAMTEMRKVSDESVASLKNFQKASFDVADSIGTTAKEVQNSAADFMRLGYSLKEATELSKDANIYANVGDMEIDEATEHMISSIKAWGSEFKNEVEASGEIIDIYNEVGKNYCPTIW